jgi:hypothetical protein
MSRAERTVTFTLRSIRTTSKATWSDFERRDSSLKYGPYDFDSVMQYDQCAFAKNCDCDKNLVCNNPTITVLAPFTAQWQTTIGQRNHLSYFDGLTMSFLYPRGDFRFVDATSSVQRALF